MGKKSSARGVDTVEACHPVKPPALKPGDTIGIIAPASPLADPDYLSRGIDFLRRRGYRVRPGRHLQQVLERAGSAGPARNRQGGAAADKTHRPGYLASCDVARLADLHEMFLDPGVRAIFCLRGGYGTLRLLPAIDYHLIRTNPKILLGYSDITALHLALNRVAGLVTFHGPMIYPELGSKEQPAYTPANLWPALTRSIPPGVIPPAPGLPPPVTIYPGRAEGPVTGGNLSLVAATLGTPFAVDTRGKILFLEEVDEAPYRIDRMLTQLRLAGKLGEAAGIVFGCCSGCDDPAAGATLPEIIAGIVTPLAVPCFYGLPAGHLAVQATLPLGIRARLDADACTLTYLEAAVAPP